MKKSAKNNDPMQLNRPSLLTKCKSIPIEKLCRQHAQALARYTLMLIAGINLLMVIPAHGQIRGGEVAKPKGLSASEKQALYTQLDRWAVHDSLNNFLTLSKAQNILDFQLNGDTANGQYWLYKAIIEYKLTNYAGALEYFDKSVGLDPFNPDVHYHQAKIYAQFEDTRGLSILELSKAIFLKNKPHYWRLRAEFAAVMAKPPTKSRFYDRNEFDFTKKAIEYGDISAVAVVHLVMQAAKVQAVPEAIDIVKPLVLKHPNVPHLLYALQQLYLHELQFSKSCELITRYNKALGNAHKNQDGLQSLAECSTIVIDADTFKSFFYNSDFRQNLHQALGMLKNLISRSPNSYVHYLQVAELYAYHTELDSMRKYIAIAWTKKDADRAVIEKQTAKCYESFQYPDSSLKYAELAIKKGSKDPELYYYSAKSYLKLGDTKMATKRLDQARKLYPSNVNYIIPEAEVEVYIAQGELKEALAHINQILQSVETATLYRTKATLDYVLGNHNIVCFSVQRAMELDPSVEIWYYLRKHCGMEK